MLLLAVADLFIRKNEDEAKKPERVFLSYMFYSWRLIMTMKNVFLWAWYW